MKEYDSLIKLPFLFTILIKTLLFRMLIRILFSEGLIRIPKK